MVLALTLGACTTLGSVTPTALVTATPISTPTASAPHTGTATFTFELGAMQWCGVFGSYRAPSRTLSGVLEIGPTTFAPSLGDPAPFVQSIAADVRPGTWVCLNGAVVRSETTTNLLTDFSVAVAPFGSMPPPPIRATPCGVVTDLVVSDLPSAGSITLTGTKFLIGGAHPAGEVVDFPPPATLRLGQSVCIFSAVLTPVDVGTFKVNSGRVAVHP